MNGSFILVLLAFFLSTAFSSYGQQEVNHISFIQGNEIHRISGPEDTVWLEKAPFSLRYFGRQYRQSGSRFAAQVAVLESEPGLRVEKGLHIDAIPFFEPGSGLAAGEDGYEEMFITHSGHHYLIYENETDKRVHLVSMNNDILELEWKISRIFYQEKEMEISSLGLSRLYFVFLTDNNLNGIADEDELKIITVIFK